MNGNLLSTMLSTLTLVATFALASISEATLLNNGGNDELLVGGEIPGWDKIVGTTWTQRSASPSPQAGTHYFNPGAGANHELAQTVDVSAYASDIDAGVQFFDFSGYVSGWRDPGDTARIIVEYEDASAVVLDSWDSGAIYNPYDEAPTWQHLTHFQFAPVGTRQVQVRLIAARNAGTNNDGYFDSIQLSTYVSANTTILTFDTGQSSNADLSLSFGSNLSADIAGASVFNGGTPDIALSWAPSPNVLEIHQGAGFATVGDGKVLQLDLNGGEADPTVTFSVPVGIALRVNSLVIGHADDMTEPDHTWTITIAESGGGPTVFTHTTGTLDAGDAEPVAINFTGDGGIDYVLTFDDGGADHFRAGIDSLNFGQQSLTGTVILVR